MKLYVRKHHLQAYLFCLIALSGAFQMVSAQTETLEFENPWQVFLFRSQDTIALNNESSIVDLRRITDIPETLYVGDIPVTAVEMNPVERRIDFYRLIAGTAFRSQKDVAICFTTVTVPESCDITIGAGADWWMEWYVNRKRVFTTVPDGNTTIDFSYFNHVFTPSLKKGKNLIAVKVVSGRNGFQLISSILSDSALKQKEVLRKQRQTHDRTMRKQLTGKASVSVDCAKETGSYVRNEKYQCWYPTTDLLSSEAISLYREALGKHVVIRLWIRPSSVFSSVDSVLQQNMALYDSLFSQAASLSTSIMLACNSADVLDKKYSLDEYTAVITKVIEHLKRGHPSFEYIDVLNEPEEKGINSDKYYRYFAALYRSVSDINNRLQPQKPLKIGGPVTCFFNTHAIEELLKNFVNDTDSRKRLDFISFHEYLFDNESRPRKAIENQKNKIRAILEKYSLPIDMPIFLGETGVFPGYNGTSQPVRDLLAQASGMMAHSYWYIEQGEGVYPFFWTTRHKQNDRKNQLVPGRDAFTPYGNALKMRGMLKDTRIYAKAKPQNDEGLGLYVLATREDDEIAVMIWNYQWTFYKEPIDYNVEVTIRNLPVEQEKEAVLRRFLIDSNHSNFRSKSGNPNLELVEETTVSRKKDVRIRIPLEMNGLTLITID